LSKTDKRTTASCCANNNSKAESSERNLIFFFDSLSFALSRSKEDGLDPSFKLLGGRGSSEGEEGSSSVSSRTTFSSSWVPFVSSNSKSLSLFFINLFVNYL